MNYKPIPNNHKYERIVGRNGIEINIRQQKQQRIKKLLLILILSSLFFYLGYLNNNDFKGLFKHFPILHLFDKSPMANSKILNHQSTNSNLNLNLNQQDQFKNHPLAKRKENDNNSNNDDDNEEKDNYPVSSTSTYSDGKITTFAFTTAAIVNPGGYTIGFYTGYRPLRTGTSSISRYTPAGSNPTPTPTPAPAPSPSSHSSTPSYETVTISDSAASPGITAASEAELKTLYSVIEEQLKSGYQGRTSSSKRGLKVKRSVEQDEEQEVTGKEEYSTSIGAETTVTFVKTTRAIVNPGGFTIGFISGLYVPVPKTTLSPPTSTSTQTSILTPTSTTSSRSTITLAPSSSSSSTSLAVRRHEELRRRNEEEEE